MNDDPRMPDIHPEAQLASYVDRSATAEERRLVEAHLAECASCRADVEFAARGRAALQALPELESPSLAQQTLVWLPDLHREASAPQARRLGTRRSRRRSSFRSPVSPRLAWGAGIAVAAGLAAVFFFGSLNGASQKRTTAESAGAANSTALSPFRSGVNYDTASFDTLARGLAREGGFRAAAGSTEAAPAPAAGGAATPAPKALDQDIAVQAVDCLRRGGGLTASAQPSYLEVASFEGAPAFIGAFPTSPSGGPPTQLIAIAVDQLSCQALYVVTLPL
jgi:hypothetical protein